MRNQKLKAYTGPSLVTIMTRILLAQIVNRIQRGLLSSKPCYQRFVARKDDYFQRTALLGYRTLLPEVTVLRFTVCRVHRFAPSTNTLVLSLTQESTVKRAESAEILPGNRDTCHCFFLTPIGLLRWGSDITQPNSAVDPSEIYKSYAGHSVCAQISSLVRVLLAGWPTHQATTLLSTRSFGGREHGLALMSRRLRGSSTRSQCS